MVHYLKGLLNTEVTCCITSLSLAIVYYTLFFLIKILFVLKKINGLVYL